MKCPECGQSTHTLAKEETVSRYYCRTKGCEVGEIIILRPVGILRNGKWIQVGKEGESD